MTDLKSMTLSQRIAYFRRQSAMTQENLAEQLGITAQAVSKWENDHSCPDIMTLPKLAELLGVTTDLLLTGTTPAASPAAQPVKKPEELVVCIQITAEDGTVLRCNLPYKAFRIGAQFSMLSITFQSSTEEENILSHLDCTEILRLIDSGVTGKVLERTADGDTITIWTE